MKSIRAVRSVGLTSDNKRTGCCNRERWLGMEDPMERHTPVLGLLFEGYDQNILNMRTR